MRIGTFGWPEEPIVDLGDIAAARETEGYVLLWLRLRGSFQTGHLNIQIHH